MSDFRKDFRRQPGLDPGIHPFAKAMDCRVKPGNDKPRERIL